MQAGPVNGNYAAPAPLNPMWRLKKGWIPPAILITGQSPRDAYYSLTVPQVFQIDGNVPGEYFYVENRRFNQSMYIGTTLVPDYNNAAFMPIGGPHGLITQGILVWRVKYGPYEVGDNGLIYASGRFGATYPENTPSETDDGVPFPGVSNTRVLSPWSDSRDPFGVPSGSPNNIFVPNTKSSTNVGMEVISENATAGYFTLQLYQTDPPNLAKNNQSNSQSVIANNNQRKLYRESSGKLHEVLENGGEIFYRNSVDNGANWSIPNLLSVNAGLNSSACITMAGGTTIVAWQQTTGSNYNVAVKQSTDGGDTWNALPTFIQTNFSCASPGPLPSISGYSSGFTLLVYRTSAGMMYANSSNGGGSWSAVASMPGSTANWNSPSTANNTTYWNSVQGNLAYATDIQSPQIMYNFFDGSWSSAYNLTSGLPGNYVNHANPNLAVAPEFYIKSVHVVWDAFDYYNYTRVIIHKKGSFRYFGTDYSVFRYQDQNLPSITGLSSDHASLVFQNLNGGAFWKAYYNGSIWGNQTFVG